MKNKFLLLLLLLAFTFCTTQKVKSIAESKSKKPNIIYVLADDLGYGDLSCFGQQKFKIHRIARRPICRSCYCTKR